MKANRPRGVSNAARNTQSTHSRSMSPGRRLAVQATAAPTAPGTTTASSSTSPSAEASRPLKPRSCVVCRSRRVRCDKLSPCSNCRRANIECVVPSNDRPPRWARRLDHLTNVTSVSPNTAPPPSNQATGQVMERLRNLEGLVKELSGQLEQASSAASTAAGGSSRGNSPAPRRDTIATSTAGMHEHMGKLMLQDANQTHYISSGFWSRISDELDGLKMDTGRLGSGDSDTSDDEDFPPREPPSRRTPSERNAFLFRNNLSTPSPDLRKLRPLPSQIPFLLDIFSENVNLFLQVVHMPTITTMVHDMRGTDMSSISPRNEALLFSIYYSAVTSMEEEDVMINFSSTKAELNLRYRLGIEHALSKADFMNAPDIVLVQAVTIFIFLARCHDTPRFVWMMTGLAIRMAQAIGLHRDGSHLSHLSPFEVEMRRRVWWALCMLDTRASEDQGSDYTITINTFDTKLPLNINDADINPRMKEAPPERQALTDMSIALVTHEMCSKARQMTGPEAAKSGASPEEQSRAVDALFEQLERLYLQYVTESENIACWVAVTATRLIMCKQTLFVYLPVLFSSSNEAFSEEIRNKLLVAAIELAEYNHALHSEYNARHWRWMFQTYTHWHAIVYLLIECSRRPWSPTLERAWVALHSSWLIPKQSGSMDRNSQIWIPLRRLMAKARKHRTAELERLRGNTPAIIQLEIGDRNIPVPASLGPFLYGKGQDMFLEHWRNLVNVPSDTGIRHQTTGTPGLGTLNSSSAGANIPTPLQNAGFGPTVEQPHPWPNASFEPGMSYAAGDSLFNTPGLPGDSAPITAMDPQNVLAGETTGLTAGGLPTDPAPGWLWADADPMVELSAGVQMDVNMDMDGDIDWNNWVQSAAGMEMNGWSAESQGVWPEQMSHGTF